MNTLDEKPAIVLWELTRACDLACRHCRAEARPGRNPLELSFEEGRRLLEEIAGWQSGMVVLTGGDPLKHPHFWDWIVAARDRGINVSVTPSATPLLTAEAIEKMRLLGVKRIALSLDGATAAAHDAFRGVEGSFNRTIEAAAMAEHCGLPLQINTTVARHNEEQLEGMAGWVRLLDAVLWSVFFLVQVGRGKTLGAFSPLKFEELFGRLLALERDFGMAIKTTEAPHYRRYQAQRRTIPAARVKGSGDGRGIVFVSHTGDIYPSGFLPVSAGNVKSSPLLEIYAKSPLFRALRDPDRFRGKCGACEFRLLCGGSRARAYAATGNPLESDPACAYTPRTRAAAI